MKKFNLEEAKAGKPVCTRDGSKARIICWDRNGSNTPIVALVDCGGRETAFFYNDEGKNPSQHSELDLMMGCGKHEGWVGVYRYKGDGTFFTGQVYDKEEDAKNDDYNEEQFDYIATIKIEWED